MSQQISIEDALAAFRKKCADLTDANVLLEARAAGLERRVAELEAASAPNGGHTGPPPAPLAETRHAAEPV